ncbi:MAG TPA: hypothetical protein VNO83_17545 [Pseudonocardia sp.]|nr:hypothetical protein [Pseudonocardia sp.]
MLSVRVLGDRVSSRTSRVARRAVPGGIVAMVGLVAMTALLTPAYARPAARPAPAPLPPGRPNASPPPPAEPNTADLQVPPGPAEPAGPSAPAAAPGPPPAEAAVSHVGSYAGAGKILNAPQTGDAVRYSRVSSQAFSGVRRL